jgi:hypothetical protein
MLIATQVFMLIACLIEMWATNWTHWIAAKILNVNFVPHLTKDIEYCLTTRVSQSDVTR